MGTGSSAVTPVSVSLAAAAARVRGVDASPQYGEFAAMVRERFPWRSKLPQAVLARDYLQIVAHHLQHLLPRVLSSIDPSVHDVLDFGCGSGGSAISLALVCPHMRI